MNDAAGAASFARHVVALWDYAYSTGDVAPFLEVSDPRCTACTEHTDRVRDWYDAGFSFQQGGLLIATGYQVEEFSELSEYHVDLQLGHTVIIFWIENFYGSDHLFEMEEWYPRNLRFRVAHRDGSWVVLEIDTFYPDAQLALEETPTA